MTGKIISVFIMSIILLPFSLAHEGKEEHSIFEWGSSQHLLTLGIVIIVFILGIISLPKSLGSNLFLAGILAIGLSHLTEVFAVSFEIITLTSESLESIEHLLVMAGLLFIGFGFHAMRKA